MIPSIIYGECHKDKRGLLSYNNSFDASIVKRFYTIENNLNLIRGWQGHKIEQRWFSVIKGEFEIKLIKINDWDNPEKKNKKIIFKLSDEALDILHVPAGYITSIESFIKGGKLLVMSDYKLGDINDDYKFSRETFIQ